MTDNAQVSCDPNSLNGTALGDYKPQFVLPACCGNCKHYSSEVDERSGMLLRWCDLEILFPTQKQSCMKQVPYTQKA